MLRLFSGAHVITTDQRWGRLAVIRLPSGTTIGIYQPRHQVAYEL
jgi:hypothetical protein